MTAGPFRTPVEPFRGATPEITEAIRDRRYLREISRQAAIFNASFAQAMEAADCHSLDDCWRHLQGALFAGIIVNRLISPSRTQRGWPGTPRGQAQQIAQDRACRLRELLSLPDPAEETTPLFSVWRVRDSLEHIDERLDRVLCDEAEGGISDWYLSDGRLLARMPTDGTPDPLPLGMRVFVPRAGLLLFNMQLLSMFQLDVDMLTLRLESRRADQQLASRISGRLQYGGTQLIELQIPAGDAALEAWRTRRRDRLELLEQQSGDGARPCDW